MALSMSSKGTRLPTPARLTAPLGFAFLRAPAYGARTMRIIAGRARGRRLCAPRGAATRPTPERVREALFSILAGRGTDALVLDLFAGTGALGLEALSRGARQAVFVESQRSALTCLMQNIRTVGLEGTSVLAMPAERALEQLSRRGQRFDLVFLDPPFSSNLLAASLTQLSTLDLLAPSAMVVCEHAGKAKPPTPPPPLAMRASRTYGDVALTFYEKGDAA